MWPYLVVALGSALGGALRHAVYLACARLFGTGWPVGTLTVNVLGSFVIGGVVGYLAARGHGATALRLFLTAGVLGGFTTFSAFSLDMVVLYERGRIEQALLYAGASLVLSVAALVAALALVRRLV